MSQKLHFLKFMGWVGIFRKIKMKKAPLPKISLLVEIGEKI